MSIVRVSLALLGLVFVTACSSQPVAGVRRYQLRGVVRGYEASSARVVVDHEAVSGFMPAMSMPFDVSRDAPALSVGDRIVSTLVVAEGRSWLEDVRVTGREGSAGSRVQASNRAVAGAVLPEFGLVDQTGAAITTRAFAGRVLVITFIYTRCPLPDFCPLMVKHLQKVNQHVNERRADGDRLALLGVTLDPEFDSPAVLRAYGESVLIGARRFDTWTLATGTAAQIADVAQFFGIDYRNQGGLGTHTLATALVGHDGRIVRVFPSNSWRPEELMEAADHALERAAAASTQ